MSGVLNLRAYFKSARLSVETPDYYPPDTSRSRPYDYVLIDGRTGATEIGGLCVGPLADRLVVVTALNDQNLHGTRRILDELGLLTPRKDVPEPWDSGDAPADQTDAPPRLGPKPTLLVASPVPFGEIAFKRNRLDQVAKLLGSKVGARLSYHPQMALLESIFIRDYAEEALSTDYLQLADQVMGMVRDHAAQLAVSSREHWWDERHVNAVDDVLRGVWHQPGLIANLMSLADAFQPKSEEELIAGDRMHRALTLDRAPSRHIGLAKWGSALSRWADGTTDPAMRARRRQEAIARFTEVTQMGDTPPEQRARAYNNRGVAYGQLDPPETEKAIVDYTAVIEMADAPADQRAIAYNNRGVAYRQLNPPETEKAIADYTAVIEMADAPADQRAIAYNNRGVAYRQLEPPETENAIADYTALTQMTGAPTELRARAMGDLGWAQYEDGRVEQAIESSRNALELNPNLASVRCNLALCLLRTSRTQEALAEYRHGVDALANVEQLDDAAKDLQDAVDQLRDLDGAAQVQAWMASRREKLVREGKLREKPDEERVTTAESARTEPSKRSMVDEAAPSERRRDRG